MVETTKVRELLERTKTLWGKCEPDSEKNGEFKFHRLEHHCADVAACLEELLKCPVLLDRFNTAADGAKLCEVTIARLAVIAFLHDLGKLNAGFQFKVRDRCFLPGKPPPKSGHIKETLWMLKDPTFQNHLGLKEMCLAWGAEESTNLLSASISHHGTPISVLQDVSTHPALWQNYNGYDPEAAAKLLGVRIRQWFPKAFEDGPELPSARRFAHLFAGIMVLADQIGSYKSVFNFVQEPDEHYIHKARQLAEKIINDRGFKRSPQDAIEGVSFKNLFNYEKERPLQQSVMDAPSDKQLLILESETGSGKTEAAVMRFVHLWQEGLVDGMYFALPTRAAAKQIHKRISVAMESMFPDGKYETVLAVPGYLQVGQAHGEHIARFEVGWDDNPGQEKICARWSAESTRLYLSSTLAVGTIDQALLASLQVKWAHLRGSSLVRSLLVVDEVHASDEYMAKLLQSLIKSHIKSGGHAFLMSATLGSHARDAFIDSIQSGHDKTDSKMQEAIEVPYPSLTIASPDAAQTIAISANNNAKNVSVNVANEMDKPDAIANMSIEAARRGAKVLVIRNTVNKSQEVFKELLALVNGELIFKVRGEATLHHSRFAAEDRNIMDVEVEKVLGKNRAEGGFVLVGTQTLEQSLDIDADYLITDICPADVLLQRMGRLHRHGNNGRPDGFKEPQCCVLIPSSNMDKGLDGGFTKYGLGMNKSGGGVYGNMIAIEATLQMLRKYETWNIPDMNREIVEYATNSFNLEKIAEEKGDNWGEHERRCHGVNAAGGTAANMCILDREETFGDIQFVGNEHKIRTRLGEDGIKIKLLEPTVGPFGELVQTFNIPSYMLKLGGEEHNNVANLEPSKVQAEEGKITFDVGGASFEYSRIGLVKTAVV